MRTAHALAVPVSFALLVTAYYLFRRRSRAFRLALGLMAALAVFNLVKGLDVEEAAVTAPALHCCGRVARPSTSGTSR